MNANNSLDYKLQEAQNAVQASEGYHVSKAEQRLNKISTSTPQRMSIAWIDGSVRSGQGPWIGGELISDRCWRCGSHNIRGREGPGWALCGE